MPDSALSPYDHAGWHGYVSSDWHDEFHDLDTWLAEHPGKTVVDKPTRQVKKVAVACGTVYVKSVSSLVDGRHFWLDLLKRLKWRLRPSRAIATLRIMREMRSAGIRCAEPLLAVRRRDSLLSSPVDIIITKELSHPLFDEVVKRLPPAQRQALVLQALPDIFAFHHQGFVHGDFIPGNMLWDGQHLHFIDHDRTWRHLPQGTRADRIRNLVQFCFHLLMPTQQPELSRAFLNAYNQLAVDHYGSPLANTEDIHKLAMARVLRKIRKYHLDNWTVAQS